MPITAIHPGDHLAEELETLNLSAAELARQLKVPTNRITGILNGQRAITGDTALRLGHFFGTSAEFWLNLQSLYELRLAEKKTWRSIKVLPTLKQRSDSRLKPSPQALAAESAHPPTNTNSSRSGFNSHAAAWQV